VLYEVVAYLHLDFNKIPVRLRSRTLALVEYITLKIINAKLLPLNRLLQPNKGSFEYVSEKLLCSTLRERAWTPARVACNFASSRTS
jgi:hypothetical protein